MLDTDTKRRIDTAGDILVGKVPDPKSQVEQITIALIYKFMDDMDAKAEEPSSTRLRHRRFLISAYKHILKAHDPSDTPDPSNPKKPLTPDDREYSDGADPIREVLIHAHYLSQRDIEICAAFDIADKFEPHTNFPGIETLHQTLRATYTGPAAAT